LPYTVQPLYNPYIQVVYVGMYLGYSPKGTQLFPLNYWLMTREFSHKLLLLKAMGMMGDPTEQ